jgi:hypothetical protein
MFWDMKQAVLRTLEGQADNKCADYKESERLRQVNL